MALKFGTNTIPTNGDYAKFGTNNLTTVKFSSTTVWQKNVTPTLTEPELYVDIYYDGYATYLICDVKNTNNVAVTALVSAYMENSIDSDVEDLEINLAANSMERDILSIHIREDALEYAVVDVEFQAPGYISSSAVWEY